MNLKEAAQQALEALERANNELRWNPIAQAQRGLQAALGDLRAALADATRQESRQVEPVAWMTKYEELAPRFHRTEDHATGWGSEPIPLYTAPPKREPLTDEQIESCIDESFEYGLDRGNISNKPVIRFARAIERAHNIGESK